MNSNEDRPDSSSVPPKGSRNEVEVVDVNCHGFNVIRPAVVYHTDGLIFRLPYETFNAADEFMVPNVRVSQMFLWYSRRTHAYAAVKCTFGIILWEIQGLGINNSKL